MLVDIERLNELAVHQEQEVERLDVGCHVLLAEVRVELLESEVLKDLLALGYEETPDLLDAGLLLEQLSVLELDAVLRVVSHQVLSKEDAWVESRSDTWVNFIYSLVLSAQYSQVCFLP